MAGSQEHTSPDCAKLPMVQADYTPKGSFEQLGDFKTYVVGPADSKGAVMLVYDVFGIKPQIQQGADMLASQGFRVYIPDLYHGVTVDQQKTDEEKQKWRETVSDVTKLAAPASKIVDELAKRHPGGVGAAGYCWGWKMIREIPNHNELKGGIAGCHPSAIAATDPDVLDVPVCLLPSSGENMEIINQIYEGMEKKNPGKNFLRQFDKSPHGWMAARADLKDEFQAKEFSDGYQALADFFNKNISL